MLRWLISTIGVTALKGEVSAMVKRASRRAALAAVAFLLWLIAFGFALAAFVLWLSAQVGAIAACGIVAGIFAVLGIGIQIGLAIGGRRRTETRSPLAGLAAGLDKELGVNAGSLGSMVVVALAGYLLGRRLFRH
jgi:uncharacterized membrane protein (DUF485 family)